jgi:hypothetical protein
LRRPRARPESGRTGQVTIARGTLLAQLLAAFALYFLCLPAMAQSPGMGNSGPPPLRLPLSPGTAPAESARGIVRLTALFAATDPRPVREGLQWRVFEDVTGPDGNHKLVAQSSDATPNLPLPDGNFIVHAALGLAGVSTRKCTLCPFHENKRGIQGASQSG